MIRAVVDFRDSCRKYSKRAKSGDDGLSGVRSDISILKLFEADGGSANIGPNEFREIIVMECRCLLKSVVSVGILG